MIEDEARIGVAIDQRGAGFQIVPAEQVDRKIMAHRGARDAVESRMIGSRLFSLVRMMRMPTVPGVFFHRRRRHRRPDRPGRPA